MSTATTTAGPTGDAAHIRRAEVITDSPARYAK